MNKYIKKLIKPIKKLDLIGYSYEVIKFDANYFPIEMMFYKFNEERKSHYVYITLNGMKSELISYCGGENNPTYPLNLEEFILFSKVLKIVDEYLKNSR